LAFQIISPTRDLVDPKKKGSHLLTPLKIIIFLTPFATFVDQLACNAVAKSLISLFFLSRMFVGFVRFV